MTIIARLIAEYFGIRSLGYMQPKNFRYYAQAYQDRFVYHLLYGLMDKKDKGYYLEIGSGEPKGINNSYFFERFCQWDGVSLDITKDLPARWYAARKNKLLIEDALQTNYKALLKPFPQTIDYLSLDVDEQYDAVLQKLPFDNYRFKIITIEHDAYQHGNLYRQKERDILTQQGYHLLCPDVSKKEKPFEDWWIHPKAFSQDVLNDLTSLDLNAKDYKQIINAIEKI